MIARQKLAVAEPRGTSRGWAKNKGNTTNHPKNNKNAPMYVGEMPQHQSLLLPNDREKRNHYLTPINASTSYANSSLS